MEKSYLALLNYYWEEEDCSRVQEDQGDLSRAGRTPYS